MDGNKTDESRARYGAWIRAAREQAGLTMEETVRRVVANGGKLGVDGLSRIERNINGARMSTLEALADVYGVEIGDLLPHTVSSPQTRLVEPLLAMLAGLDEEEIEAWIGQIAQTVGLQRSFMERRARRNSTRLNTSAYISTPNKTDKPPGDSGEREEDVSAEATDAARRHRERIEKEIGPHYAVPLESSPPERLPAVRTTARRPDPHKAPKPTGTEK